MHEFSIAEALLGVVRSNAPPKTVVRTVRLEAGPMRGIESLALDWAWDAVVRDTELAQSRLELRTLPWRLRCPQCGRRWAADDVFEPCTCGCDNAHPDGTNDALRVAYLDVDDIDDAPDSDAADPVAPASCEQGRRSAS